MTPKLRYALVSKQEALIETTEALSQAKRDFNKCHAVYQDACADCNHLDASAAWKDLGKLRAKIEDLENQSHKHHGDLVRLQAIINRPSDKEIA